MKPYVVCTTYLGASKTDCADSTSILMKEKELSLPGINRRLLILTLRKGRMNRSLGGGVGDGGKSDIT